MNDKKQSSDKIREAHAELKRKASETEKQSSTEEGSADEQASIVNLDDVKTEIDAKDATGETAQDSPPEDPIAILEAEVAGLKDKYLRQTADMENLRRRTEREKQDIAKYAISNFARDILSIDDNLQRTLQAAPDESSGDEAHIKSLIEGVEMTTRELVNVFERHGIIRTDPKGEIFDPNQHQALYEVENPAVPVGTIMEVVATGYMIGERVLRPAMVGLAKGGEKPAKNTPASEKENENNGAETKNDSETTGNVDKTV